MTVKFLDNESLIIIRTKYGKAEKRLILIDYDGTLIPLATFPEAAILNEKTEATIGRLISDIKNKIVIISGRKRMFLESQFKNTDVVLIAEHGYFIKNPGKRWVINHKINLTWKENILPILILL